MAYHLYGTKPVFEISFKIGKTNQELLKFITENTYLYILHNYVSII